MIARRFPSDVAFCALLALALSGIAFALQGHVGFGMQDESFLWYGVQRTHAGEVPLRDFRSYDPGRYWWCAVWATWFGDGLVAVRGSSWIFASLGLACGLLAARRAVTQRWMLVPIGLVLVAWMSPPWKLFESSVAMACVLFGTRLVENPSRARHLAAGALVGLAAVFGRNLGLYAGVALAALAAFVAWKRREPGFLGRFGALGVGVVLGYAPVLLACAFADGFGEAFVESVRLYARQDALNAALPVPWPWRVDFRHLSLAGAVSATSIGLAFLLLFAFPFLALLAGMRTRAEDLGRRALLVASAFVGACFLHHASVRSDVPHLAQSLHPMLLGTIAAGSALARAPRGRLTAAIVLAWIVVSALTIVPSSAAARRSAATPPAEWVATRIGSDDVFLSPAEATSIGRLRALVESNVGPDQTIWCGAHFIGLYPILGRRSPVWDLYPAWTSTETLEARMTTELARVDWALLDTRPIGGDPDMTLARAYPEVWRVLQRDFERVPVGGAPDSLLFLRRKRV